MDSELDLVGSAKRGVQIGEAFATAFFYVIRLMLKPLALVTQVLVRRSFGERYFTDASVLLSMVLIAGGVGLTRTIPVFSASHALYLWMAGTNWKLPPFFRPRQFYWIWAIWMILFVAAAWENRIRAWLRNRKGERWHSRCVGVSRISGMGNVMQYLVVIGLAICADLTGDVVLSGLIVTSLSAAIVIDRGIAKDLYNRALDAIDGQIESEELGKAIEQRLSPKQASGLHARLPRRLSNVIVEMKPKAPVRSSASV